MKKNNLALLVGLICGLLIKIPYATANNIWVTCTPVTVGTYDSRIHIRCSQSYSGIVFFAYNANDSAGAARYMSMGTSALISGRNMKVLYDPSKHDGAQIGCEIDNCRLLEGLEILY